jgi:hypothetical protein
MAQSTRDNIAHMSAIELTGEFGTNLVNEVDEELRLIVETLEFTSTEESFEKFTLGISVAALIVQIASFSVQINDSFIRDNHSAPSNEQLYLAVQQEIMQTTNEPLSPAQNKSLNIIIKVTVTQTLL